MPKWSWKAIWNSWSMPSLLQIQRVRKFKFILYRKNISTKFHSAIHFIIKCTNCRDFNFKINGYFIPIAFFLYLATSYIFDNYLYFRDYFCKEILLFNCMEKKTQFVWFFFYCLRTILECRNRKIPVKDFYSVNCSLLSEFERS